MTVLARTLRTVDYFTLGFGTMVGVGWLVLMDDWLGRGGPLGGVLGFVLGGLLLLPIASVYGRLVTLMPDAGGEVAYTAKVFPSWVSFVTGWIMMLAYLIVCPWEAVAIGRLASYVFPALNSMELYQVAGRPVYLPQLVLGLALTALITCLNYRGVRTSATFQNWTTFGLLALSVVFISLGFGRGTPHNWAPAFSHAPLLSVLLVLQIVPYFMVGFESITKGAEEAHPAFRSLDFLRAMTAAIIVAMIFYAAVIAAASYVHPWKTLVSERFATAVAFEHAFGSRRIVAVIFAAALLSLLKVFNGNFLAASRMFFALGRRGLVDSRLSHIHPHNQTPDLAVLAIGLLTAVAVFLGDAILVPVTEVGSLAGACGWLASCASCHRLQAAARDRAFAVTGIVVSTALILMKLLPFVPGSFTRYEYLALVIWMALGLVLRKREASTSFTEAR